MKGRKTKQELHSEFQALDVALAALERESITVLKEEAAEHYVKFMNKVRDRFNWLGQRI
jgi:hypothetical protein